MNYRHTNEWWVCFLEPRVTLNLPATRADEQHRTDAGAPSQTLLKHLSLFLHFLDKKAQWVLERLNGLADGLKQESACRSRETSTEVVISISNSEPDRCSTHTQRSLWQTGFVGINFLTERQKVMRQWKIERIPNGFENILLIVWQGERGAQQATVH